MNEIRNSKFVPRVNAKAWPVDGYEIALHFRFSGETLYCDKRLAMGARDGEALLGLLAQVGRCPLPAGWCWCWCPGSRAGNDSSTHD